MPTRHLPFENLLFDQWLATFGSREQSSERIPTAIRWFIMVDLVFVYRNSLRNTASYM